MQGKHLLLRADGVKRDVDDTLLWEAIIDECVKLSNTTKVRNIVFHKFDGQGMTAFAVLGESHISVHTYPENEGYYMDVFSCKDFETQPILDLLQSMWGNHQIVKVTVER